MGCERAASFSAASLQRTPMLSDRLSPGRAIGMFLDGDIRMHDGLKARLYVIYMIGLRLW
jgi:hypothetical protein